MSGRLVMAAIGYSRFATYLQDLFSMDMSSCLLPEAAMAELARACDVTANWHDKVLFQL